MACLRIVGLFSTLFLYGCGSDQAVIGNERDGFPIDLGAVQDFKISFPIKILNKSKGVDIDTTLEMTSETLEGSICEGVGGCAFVKRISTHVEGAGNFLTGSFAGADTSQTIYFRANGSMIQSIDSDNVTCSAGSSSVVRGQIGSAYETDQLTCSDGNNPSGVTKVFRYNQELAEVTAQLNGGQVRTTMLVDRKGKLMGMAILYMEMGATFQGSSYNVQNPYL